MEKTRTLTLNEMLRLNDEDCTYSNFKSYYRNSALLKDKGSKKYLIKIWDDHYKELYESSFNSLKEMKKQMLFILENELYI